MFIPGIMYRYNNWTIKKAEHWRTDALNCVVGEDSWESLEQQGVQISQFSLQFRSIHFSHSVLSDSLRPHGLQHDTLPCPSPTLRAYSNLCPSRQWCHSTILSSVVPSPPAFNLSQHQGLFQQVASLHQVAKVLEFQLQHQSSQWTFTGLIDFL